MTLTFDLQSSVRLMIIEVSFRLFQTYNRIFLAPIAHKIGPQMSLNNLNKQFIFTKMAHEKKQISGSEKL